MKPTPEQVREALAYFRSVAPIGHSDIRKRELAEHYACLESALAPPPVEDAAVEPEDELLHESLQRIQQAIHVAQGEGWSSEFDPLEPVRAALASLRSQVAAKDAEIEMLKECVAHDLQRWGWAEDEIRELRADVRLLVEKGSKIADDRDAAENRGFREAAEWLEEKNGKRPSGGPSVFSVCVEWDCVNGGVRAIRAEADRREGNRKENYAAFRVKRDEEQRAEADRRERE